MSTVEPEVGACPVCQSQTPNKCTDCTPNHYCCEDHLKQHLDKPFEILDNKILVSTRDLEPQDLILEEYPLVFGPKSKKIEAGSFPCLTCCRTLDNLETERCPECFWPICSLDCLKAAKWHDIECRILRLRPQQPNNSFYQYYRFDVLIILRALALQKNDQQKWNQLLNLGCHIDKPDSDQYKNVQEKVKFLEENYWTPLRAYEHELGEQIILDTTNEIIHKLFAILEQNSLEQGEMQLIYGNVSLMEHNCVPNTVQKMDAQDNYKITVRACLPIKKGEHPTLSRTNILWGTHSRLQDLKRRHLTCSCSRCSDPTELGTFFSALKCFGDEKTPCGGTQLPLKPLEENTEWQCCKCPIVLPNEELMKFVEHLGKEAQKWLDKPGTLLELEEIVNKLLNFLTPSHFLLFKLKHKIVLLSDKPNEKLKLCDELLNIAQRLDPGNSQLGAYVEDLQREKFGVKFAQLRQTFEAENSGQFLPQVKELLGMKSGDLEALQTWIQENHVQLD